MAPPGAEGAGKPGYYTVKPGDALIRDWLEGGQSWKDIARWNNLENPNLIEVGQVLRVVPPHPRSLPLWWGSDSATTSRPVTTATPAPVATSPAGWQRSPSVSPSSAGASDSRKNHFASLSPYSACNDNFVHEIFHSVHSPF